MNKRMIVLGAGAVLGVAVAPMILDVFKIESAPGFGMDDVLTGIVVAAAVMLVDAVI